MYCPAYIVEPLNNRHIGTDHFVHYREVVPFGGKNALPLYRLVHWKVSFIQRCPLSFIGGFTVYTSIPILFQVSLRYVRVGVIT